ncbi:threonine/serine ThrE exporter family protein [Photobacterium galatheae]|uniref:threonine/serine ThrE exporter family protein n=1 Tax=Photobacterium galatheae TaxID=1654360 RepID=UPI00055F769A|nr:threonine/serine exporter family protein [Photobacterium galatheae]MCM0148000.1 threonine/serine exporter family protein [Photobacterium galatheae]
MEKVSVSVLRDIARIVAQVGQKLLQHGAESAVVVNVSQRVGLAMGAEEVDIALTANAIVVTIRRQGHCMTTTRRCRDHGINMAVITRIHHVCIMAEKGLLDHRTLAKRLDRIQPQRYPPVLVTVMIGLSCGAFSILAGGDGKIAAITALAAAAAMALRLMMAQHHFNPLLTFAAAAFVATSVSAIAPLFGWGNQPFLAMASSVLLLVPGFPLINAVADMVSGFVNLGISRWVMASLLTMATSLGIVAAMNLFNVWGWLA